MKTVTLILACAMAFVLAALHAFGQGIEPDLKNKRITIKAEKAPLRMVFRILMEDYNVPIGFEKSTLDSNHDDFDFVTNLPPGKEKSVVKIDGKPSVAGLPVEQVFSVKNHLISINFENARLKDVLDKIVRQMKNYKWKINDGVVNIFPVKGRDQIFRKLLKTNIKNFTFEGGTKIIYIRFYISDLPKFKEFLSKNGISLVAGRLGFAGVLSRIIPDEMKFANLTFQELLNKITKIKGGGWILKKSSIYGTKEMAYIDIDI